jgi:hypothetical protein
MKASDAGRTKSVSNAGEEPGHELDDWLQAERCAELARRDETGISRGPTHHDCYSASR